MKSITNKYFNLIVELKLRLQERDIVEILNVYDKIKLFWNKNKALVINELKNKKEVGAIIGGMTYPHFYENHHFIPLAHSNLLIIDEPFSKMDEIIRLTSINNPERILDIVDNTVEIFLENKELILNNNIVIVPLRDYFGLDNKNIFLQANKLVYSSLNYMFNAQIKNESDLKELSKKYDTFEKIDEMILSSNRDIVYFGNNSASLPIKDKLIKSYKDGGLDFDKISSTCTPILMITNYLYGYSAQIFDILNITEIIKTDLFLFIEIPAFYFNILLENILSDNEELYKKYLKTMISYFLHKSLYCNNYFNLDINEFYIKYKNYNLLELINEDFIKKNCSRFPTDINSIKKFIDIRVEEFRLK